MKKVTKWAIGLSVTLAVMLVSGVAVARYALAVVSAVVSQGVFYNNGWSMIDDDHEEYMRYICGHDINQDDLDYLTYLEQRDGKREEGEDGGSE